MKAAGKTGEAETVAATLPAKIENTAHEHLVIGAQREVVLGKGIMDVLMPALEPPETIPPACPESGDALCNAADEAPRAASGDQRHAKRTPSSKTGRLAFGGLNPGMVGCQLHDLSETGVRLETYVALTDFPAFFTLEFDGAYYRGRLIWMRGKELGLAFMPDEF